MQDMDARLEAEWIRGITAGDRLAFRSLFQAYQKRLYRYLMTVVGETGPADELVNDVMVAVWKGAGSFRGESRPSTWIFGIAHHKAMNHIRRKPLPLVDLDAASEVPDPAEGPEQNAERARLAAALGPALERLSPAQREVVEMTFGQGLSYPEIAAITRCPVGTVKTRMFHAKKLLLAALAGDGARGGAR